MDLTGLPHSKLLVVIGLVAAALFILSIIGYGSRQGACKVIMRIKLSPLFIIPFIGAIFSFAAFYGVKCADDRRVATLCDIRVNYRFNDFQYKLLNMAQPVQSLAVFYAAQLDGDVAPVEFVQFTDLIDLKKFPLRAISWAPLIRKDGRASFEHKTNVAINELSPEGDGTFVASGERDEYYPVATERAYENQHEIIAFDLIGDERRRDAVLRARDQGRPISAPVKSVMIDELIFDIFVPVYEGGVVPPTVEERRQKIRGIVFGTYRVGASLNAAIQGTPEIVERINFLVSSGPGRMQRPAATYDNVTHKFSVLSMNAYFPVMQSPSVSSPTLIPDQAVTASGGDILISRTFDVYSQQWTLLFDFDTSYTKSLESLVPQWSVLGLGLALTSFVAVFAFRQRQANAALQLEIEARSKSEKELRSTENILALIFDNIPNMIFVKDANDLHFVKVNRAGESLLGIEQADLLGKNDFDFFPRSEAEFFVARDREALRRKDTIVIAEEPVSTRGNGIRLLQTKKIPVLNERGEAQFLLGVSEDITDRKRAEEQRRSDNARYRAIVDTAVDGIVVIDEIGTVLAFNKAAEQMFGYTAGEVIGKNVKILMPEPYMSGHDTFLSNYRETGRRKIIGIGREVQGLHRKKGPFPLDLQIGEWVADGKRYFTGTLRDITERKAMAMQLIQSQKMEAIGQLTGGMAHDFNNILGIIIGNLDLAKEQFDVPVPEVNEAIEAAVIGAKLVHRLLGFARRQPLQPRLLSLNEVVVSLVPLLRRTIGSAIEVKTKLGDNLWMVLADPAQFENGILNLALNSRDAMPKGGTLTIATQNKSIDNEAASTYDVPEGDYAVVSVSDNGCGMSSEVLARVFEPFYTTKEQGKGSGLGLSMVFGYAKQSGGTVKIYSEEGRGTIVRLYLPRVTNAGQEEDMERSETEINIPRGNERILLVEDAPKARIVAQRILISLGYSVTAAEDALAALMLIDAGQEFDLLFTDIVMPGPMNGLDLARIVVQRRPLIKVLLTSGFSEMTSTEITKLAAGFLVKPYRKAELAVCLRKLLDISKVIETAAQP